MLRLKTKEVNVNLEDISQVNRDRMLAAASLKEPDQVPVWFDLDTRYFCAPEGYGVKDYVMHFCPSLMLNLMLEARRKFKGLTFVRPHFNVAIESSAFGCKIRWPDKGEAQDVVISPIVKTSQDVKELEVPNPYLDGLFPADFDSYRFMRKELADRGLDIPIWMGYGIRGPFTLAAILSGGLPAGLFNEDSMARILDWVKNQPGVAQELIKKCTETIIAYIRAQREVMGIEQEIMLCDDFSSYLSPEQFEEFSVPYLARIYKEFDHPLNIYHNCHPTNHQIELIPETQAKIFHLGPEKACDLARAKKLIGRRICLMGNINPDTTLVSGGPQEVEADARRCIEMAAEGGGFILAEASGVRRGTPDENVYAVIDAAEKYGKYPIRRRSK